MKLILSLLVNCIIRIFYVNKSYYCLGILFKNHQRQYLDSGLQSMV
jgi:hypothetical protein